MNDTQYLFVGGIFPKETEEEILKNSKGSVQNAANALQWNLIKGFDEHLGEEFSILSAPYIGSFPRKYKKLFIQSHTFSHKENAQDYNVGFCNLTGLKRYSIRKGLKKQIKKWVKSKKRKALIAYAMTDSSMQSIAYAKKLDPTIKTCLVVPDLPQYMNTGSRSSFIYRTLKKIDWRSIKQKMQFVDTFVLLTDQMSKFLGVDNYVVMEGIASDSFENTATTQRDEKTILYAGTLNYKYGIGDLLEAFKLIKDPDYKLMICGSGEAAEQIKKEQQEDPRIQFLGLLPRAEVLRLLKTVTVLINPRKNKEEYTKYSFPSKIMEYLASGTPVVAYELDGMPKEYAAYIRYVMGDAPQDLAAAITDICERPKEERETLGKKARDFVLKEKNATQQTKRILEYLQKVEK